MHAGNDPEKPGKFLTDTDSIENLHHEILKELEKRIPDIIKQDECDTIKDLCVSEFTCDKQTILQVVLKQASAQRRAHPSFHKFVSCLRRILDPIDRFSAALDMLSQAGGSISLLVWGSIRIVIQASKDLSEIPTFINECLEQLNNALPLWDQYQEILRDDPQSRIRAPAVRICVEYLTFCILATRHAKARLWEEIAQAATKVIENKLRKCVRTIQEQRTLIDHWFGVSTYKEVYQLSNKIDNLRYTMTEVFTSEKAGPKGSTVPIRFIPGGLRQRFVGRAEELRWLESVFTSGSANKSGRRAALYGMTGIGKTQLMLKYEKEFGETYHDASLFIVAGSQEKFLQSCHEVLDFLGLPERERPEPQVKIHGLRKWLEQRESWLLMIDNVSIEELQSIQDLLASVKHGHVLVTSQNFAAVDRIADNAETCREVKELLEEDAVNLFLLTSNTDKDSQNKDSAREVVKEVGYLPHMIDQSAWYVRKHDIEINQYLERYRKTPNLMLEWQDQDRTPIAKHFNMAFQDLARNHPDSMDILCLFSFFEPEAIPKFTNWHRDSDDIDFGKQNILRTFFSLGCFTKKQASQRQSDHPAPNANPQCEQVCELCKIPSRLEDAIGGLWNLNLIRRNREKGVLWMHDITCHMARNRVRKAGYRQWLESAIHIVYHTFPEKDNSPEEHSLVDIYLPQAATLIRQAQESELDLGKYAQLLVICARCYHNRGEYRKAIEWYKKALKPYQEALGTKNCRTITVWHGLAWSYRESGDHFLAEKMYRQTLKLRSKVLGPGSPEALESLNDLAALIERSGRLKEAEKLFIPLYQKQKTTFGPHHRVTLAGGHNLALCYANQGRLAKAEELYRQTLSVSKRVFGMDDGGTIKTLGNLAVTLDHEGRLQAAESLYDCALETYRRLLGCDDLLTLRVQSNMSGLYRQQGHFSKAERMINEVLEVYMRVLGSSHYHTAVALHDVAEVLHDKGSLYEAGKIYEMSIKIMETESTRHPLTFRAIDAAGILERERGDLAQARHRTERAYNGNLELLGWLDPYTLVAANNYAELLHAEGQYDEARDLYHKCLRGFEELLGKDHPHCMMVLNNLGRLSWTTGNKDAVSFFSPAYELLKGILGEYHSNSLTVALNVARTQLGAGQTTVAYASMLKVREGCKEAPEISLPRLGVVEFFLGMAAASNGGPDSMATAIIHFKNSADSYINTLGAIHPNYFWARCMLVRALYAVDTVEEAAIYLSTIETQPLFNSFAGPEIMGLGKPKYCNLVSMDLKEFDWKAFIQLPFGETIRLRWGRKTVWREQEPAKLHS